MAKVVGLGGVFFKTEDPAALARWYHEHLGMPIDIENPTYGATLQPESIPRGGFQVWSPFNADTKYLDPSKATFMFNLMVDDVAGALEQVVAAGATQVGDIEDSEFGRFGWFMDPAGNKVELWEPPEPQQ